MKQKKITYLLTAKKIFLATVAFILLTATPKISSGQTQPGCPNFSQTSTPSTGCGCNGTITIDADQSAILPIRYKIRNVGDPVPNDYITVNSLPFTINNLCNGAYKLIILDNREETECSAYCPEPILSGPDPLVVKVESECDWERNGCDGSWVVDAVASGGTPPYRYRWTLGGATPPPPHDPNSSRLKASTAGVYRVTVTDAASPNCSADDDVYVGPLEIIPTITDADCHNPRGKIDIEVKGGKYICGACTRADGSIIPIVKTHIFKVDDNNAFINWNGNDLPEFEVDYTDSGLVANSHWSSLDPNRVQAWTKKNFSIKSLPPGKYRVKIADDGGDCIKELDFEIKMKEIEVSGIVTQSSCTDPCSGSISVTATGGEGPYIYNWRKDGQPYTGSGANTTTISSLCEGDYEVEVMGNDGCATTSQTLTINPELSIAYPADFEDQYCFMTFGQQRVKVKLKPITTGTGPYTYSWSTSSSNIDNYYNAVPGETNISVTITDARGCSVTITGIDAINCPSPPNPFDVTAQIMPNPTFGQFTVRTVVTGLPHEVDIKITDNMSNIIYYENKGVLQPGTHDFPIDISSSPAGTYHVIVDWGNISINLVKQ